MGLAVVIVVCVISLPLAAYNLWPLSTERQERAVRNFERQGDTVGGSMKHWLCRVLVFPRIWWKISVSALAVAFTVGWGLVLEVNFFELAGVSFHLFALCIVGAGTAVLFSVFFAIATQRAEAYCRGKTVRQEYAKQKVEHAERQRWHDEQFERCLGECIVEAGGGTPVWEPAASRVGGKP